MPRLSISASKSADVWVLSAAPELGTGFPCCCLGASSAADALVHHCETMARKRRVIHRAQRENRRRVETSATASRYAKHRPHPEGRANCEPDRLIAGYASAQRQSTDRRRTKPPATIPRYSGATCQCTFDRARKQLPAQNVGVSHWTPRRTHAPARKARLCRGGIHRCWGLGCQA